MTVQEFWDSKEKLAIHCDTEEKANKLLKKFDELGKIGANGGSYLKNNNWILFKEKTCYGNDHMRSDVQFYKENCEFTIIEFDDLEDFKEPKSFTKNDLKNGMVVETRNRERFMVFNGELIGKDGFIHIVSYDYNLTISGVNEFDIVKIFKETNEFGTGFNAYLDDVYACDIIWERKEEKEPLLTEEEKKKLVVYKENIFKFSTSEQIYIEKTRNDLLKIYSSNIEIWCYEIKNNDFKNLELGKKYTLKELGL